MASFNVRLEDFDPQLIVEYAITENDLTNVYTYLQAMQSHLDIGTWDDIQTGDWDDLFETNLPFVAPSEEEIFEAEKLLAKLRRQGKT
ncbi:hypothetical protein KFU94_29555 [Chloroflexi bacterium TSY]|nr:hypothetical protein [Chloroflexi bacterium TSY]